MSTNDNVFCRAMAANQAETSQLQQQMKILQDEMSRNVMRLNASENAKQILESKVNKYESEMKHMSTGQVRQNRRHSIGDISLVESYRYRGDTKYYRCAADTLQEYR